MKRFALILIALPFLHGCASQGGFGSSESYLSQIVVSNLEFTNEEGMPWDTDGSGPDVVIAIIPDGAMQSTYTTAVQNNLKANKLPLSLSIDSDIQFTEGEWQVAVYDKDDKDNEIMDVLTFNPAEIDASSVILRSNQGKVTTIELIAAEK